MANLIKWSKEKIINFVKEHPDSYLWLCTYVKLSEEFIEEYADKVDWSCISTFQKLSESFIEKHIDKVDWYQIGLNQHLSMKFIEKYAYKMNWFILPKTQKLSLSFMRKYYKKLHSYYLVKYQKLSESFLEKYLNIISRQEIEEHQQLSEKFIEKHINILNVERLMLNQPMKLSFVKKVLKPHCESESWEKYLSDYCKIHNDKRNKHQKWKEMKIYADKWGLEINSSKKYIIAYRSHSNLYRGYYNLSIHYNKPGYYKDWRCDLNPKNRNSFGLGIWPSGNVKVQVGVDNWGCEVKYDSEGKARVFGFILLNID